MILFNLTWWPNSVTCEHLVCLLKILWLSCWHPRWETLLPITLKSCFQAILSRGNWIPLSTWLATAYHCSYRCLSKSRVWSKFSQLNGYVDWTYRRENCSPTHLEETCLGKSDVDRAVDLTWCEVASCTQNHPSLLLGDVKMWLFLQTFYTRTPILLNDWVFFNVLLNCPVFAP